MKQFDDFFKRQTNQVRDQGTRTSRHFECSNHSCPFIHVKVVNLKFWELLQIYIACISPRTNEGIRETDLMTNVLDGEFDQKGYLEVALQRMAYPKALGCPGWQLLLPVTDAMIRYGIDPDKMDVQLKTITEFNPDSLNLNDFKVCYKPYA